MIFGFQTVWLSHHSPGYFLPIAVVFRKSLRLTHESRRKFASGKITNLMTTDAEALQTSNMPITSHCVVSSIPYCYCYDSPLHGIGSGLHYAMHGRAVSSPRIKVLGLKNYPGFARLNY